MQKHLMTILALFFVVQTGWADDVNSSVSLTEYYATANDKGGNELRMALFDVIKGHTSIGYKQLGTIMQWSDTENADGQNVIDIYSDCTYTTSGPITWGNASSVGGAMNREHTVPQSWFDEDEPMKSDAFHVYPSDCKANNNRSSYLYGEFSGNGTSYSSGNCKETGKLSTGNSNSIASYTYENQTYTPTATWSGQVYEPADEYKGDLARSYFYMATRYADKCATWSGGAFSTARNGLGVYTAELMLKWHRLDPVSEKELIRNEVIYGNPQYNKSSKKQGNRNPFIDYPELAEYIWGDKQELTITLTALDSPYANEQPLPDGIESIGGERMTAKKMLVNGQLIILVDGKKYTLMGQPIQ